MRSLLAIRHLDVGTIQSLIDTAAGFRKSVEAGKSVVADKQRTIGLLFFENSTRTRVSFEQACAYLGYRCVNFSGSGSSMKKGETLRDTILTLKYERLEAVVMRHQSAGACNLAAQYFGGPVINAGDGCHEHPTQALSDAMTILERKGRIKSLKVAIVGDVSHSRVARSDAWILSKLGAEIRFVGPRTLIPGQTSSLPGAVYYDLRAGLAEADVVVALRLQKERMDAGLVSVSEFRRLYQVNRMSMRAAAPDAIVMHPGPLNRGVEIDDFTADGPASVINEQVTNGIFVRMAALTWAFDVASAKKGAGAKK